MNSWVWPRIMMEAQTHGYLLRFGPGGGTPVAPPLVHQLRPSASQPTRNSSAVRSVRLAVQRHINGIEGLWSDAKEHFRKYHGVSRQYFPLYL